MMGTNITPELSKKNKYYIPKHRYYELKHFCLQYDSWKKSLGEISWINSGFGRDYIGGDISNPTVQIAEKRAVLMYKIQAVESTAKSTDPVLGAYILKAVTEGCSYEKLNAQMVVGFGTHIKHASI